MNGTIHLGVFHSIFINDKTSMNINNLRQTKVQFTLVVR